MKIVIVCLLLCQISLSSSTTETLTRENVYDLCVKYHDSPEWTFRQAMYESGHLKNNRLINKCHNLFGMKYPYQRETMAIGKDHDGTAIYATWEDSVKDYAKWQEFSTRKDGESYCDYLVRRSYCKANGEYIKTLKRIKVRF